MKVLIVDDDQDLAELIEFAVLDCFPGNTRTFIAKSGNAAIRTLKNEPHIDLCICDHSMPNGQGDVVQRHILSAELATKFVLCSTFSAQYFPDKYDLDKIFFSIQKPEVGEGIQELYRLFEKKLGPMEHKTEYCPVSVHVLALMGRAPLDIYIRMSDNKYLKCINKGDTFTTFDQDKYVGKHVHHLYVLRNTESINALNSSILQTTQKILDQRSMPLSDKMGIVHSQLTAQIRHLGLTSELAAVSKEALQKSVSIMMSSPQVQEFWKTINLLGDYPTRLYTLHSLLASNALSKTKLYGEEYVFKLVFSAFIQDLTLDSIALMEICDYEELIEKKSQFSPAEMNKFLEHPTRAAEIMSQFKDLPPETVQIMLEQHEMPNGAGIPARLKASEIGPLSGLFIITGIFARHFLREDDFDFMAFMKFLEKRGYSQGNFQMGFEALKALQNSIVF